MCNPKSYTWQKIQDEHSHAGLNIRSFDAAKPSVQGSRWMHDKDTSFLRNAHKVVHQAVWNSMCQVVPETLEHRSDQQNLNVVRSQFGLLPT